MDLVEKYYNMILNTIEEAKNDGIEITTYYSQIKNEVVDSGIIVGTNIIENGEYKSISTWK